MPKRFQVVFIAVLACGLCSGYALAQSPAKAPAVDPNAAASHAIELSEKGRCKEALPLLKKSGPTTPDKHLKVKAGVETVRCGLTLGQEDAAVAALLWLNRSFPTDPEVLYITTHAYSDLSSRAAMQLAQSAPSSYQAHELNAESLEMQGKWDDAVKEYRLILEQDPQLAGMHFRIGRAILSQPETPTTAADARAEFEQELKIDPNNAAAEYILGELSAQSQNWDEAIQHFSRASQLNAGFAEAYLGLGSAYGSSGKFAEAIAPLETYVKLQPGNPAGHYQLAIAYSRSGRKDDAKREAALQKEMADRLDQEKQRNANALQKQAQGQDPQKPESRN